MATFTKTGDQSAIEWIFYGDSTSLVSSTARSALMVGVGVLASKPIKKMVSNIIQPSQSQTVIAPANQTSRVIQQ